MAGQSAVRLEPADGVDPFFELPRLVADLAAADRAHRRVLEEGQQALEPFRLGVGVVVDEGQHRPRWSAVADVAGRGRGPPAGRADLVAHLGEALPDQPSGVAPAEESTTMISNGGTVWASRWSRQRATKAGRS